MKAIVNTKLIMEDGIIWDGALTYDQGTIVEVGWAHQVHIPEGTQCLDAQGKYTAPGLIDIHNHGTQDDLFCDEPLKCAQFFLGHGTTTVLPTFYCNLTLEQMQQGAERVRQASETGAGRILNGIYMEGPYMNGNGSNQKSIRWLGDITEEEYGPLLDSVGDLVRVWAIDPARDGIERFMKDVKRQYPDAIFAYGHSTATAADCRRVKKLGVKVQCHHSDSGKAKGYCQCTIGAGCDEFTLYDPDLYAELICDENGVHVDPDMIKMVVRTKGVERMILITDSMASKEKFLNSEAAGVAYGPDLNYDYQGHLAGSRLTLDNACRNLMKHTGYGLCHAIRFATINPARMLGIEDTVGSLEAGKKANLIVIDDMVRVETVILEGETMVQPQ